MTTPNATDVAVPAPKGFLLVDDHDFVRMGTISALQAWKGEYACPFRVWEARSLADAQALYAREEPHIALVLLDLHLNDAHGLSGLGTFMRSFPAARVVVLTADTSAALEQQARALGAVGYLLKAGETQAAMRYLFSLFNGVAAQPPHSVEPGALASGHHHGGRLPGRSVRTVAGNSQQLTLRQSQLLDWILAGKNNKEIALLAGLSEGTVKNHVSALLLLVGVRSRAQLISHLR